MAGGIDLWSLTIDPTVPRYYRHYRTAMVAESRSPAGIMMVTTTSSPGSTPFGITTSTWYSPANPGASPANSTVAGTPPIETCGVAALRYSTLPFAGRGLPRHQRGPGGSAVTRPNPVQ